MKKTIKTIIDKIKSSKTFLVTAHMNLEGDALGSELSMYGLLRKLGKKVIVCNNDPTPQIYEFLPYTKVIKNDLKNETFDVAMVLDCSDPFRTGKIKDYLPRAKCIINIDHHISNTYFGDLNWVDAKASSACQILYTLCEKMGVMDKKIALCLYTGIFTDSGNFTYESTSEQTHKIVSTLMRYDIKPHRIYGQLHSLCFPQDLKFIGSIISFLKFDPQGKVCWSTIKVWEEKDYDLTEVIFSAMRLLKGVEVFILFKKVAPGKIRVNFRSRAVVDVNRIAQFFGGGGHKRASGTTIDGTLEGVENKVITFVKRSTNKLKS
ncbi:MAG: bifunctional oligoribonuclease/PAP phosphatase NrnA [Candidatus Omnitrophota bacterium]|nr:bifunctional oligoribonuclease/PAP phosphatase NrnA [Candidatus Omnitrophota bacterium]